MPKDLAAVARPPNGAILLFDGNGDSSWRNPGWLFTSDHIEIVPSTKAWLTTRESFGSCRLYLEWWTPPDLAPERRGQKRSNSGVFFQGLYEVQILDTYENSTYSDGMAGALYGQHPPSANPLRPAGEWQSFEIHFTRPLFHRDGSLLRPARFTVRLNGVVVQENAELVGPTVWRKRPPYAAHPDKLPLALQNHGDVVRFRNIWLVPIDD